MTALSHSLLGWRRNSVTPARATISCLTRQGPLLSVAVLGSDPERATLRPPPARCFEAGWGGSSHCAWGSWGGIYGDDVKSPWGDCPWDGSSSPEESGKLGLMEDLEGWSNYGPGGSLPVGCKWAWGKWGDRGCGGSVTLHCLVFPKDLGGLQTRLLISWGRVETGFYPALIARAGFGLELEGKTQKEVFLTLGPITWSHGPPLPIMNFSGD